MTVTVLNPDNIDFSDIEEKCVAVLSILMSLFICPRYQVHYDEGFDKTVIVDGIPIIDKSKEERLLTKIAKEFTKKGVSIKPDDIYLPWDNKSGKSKGYAHSISLIQAQTQITCRFIFIDFRSADDANVALAALHNHPFDAKHTFKLNKFTDVEKFANMDETYVEPETEEFVSRVCYFL
jgi:translation initiation factor 3 subunit B